MSSTAWRSDPATKMQKQRLDEEGVKYKKAITKGEASDLLSSIFPPTESELQILNHFKVKLPNGAKQVDARRAIEEIMRDPINRESWENRPIDKEQREILRFFGVKTKKGIKHSDAALMVDELFHDPDKTKKWDEYEELYDEACGYIDRRISKPKFFAHYKKLMADGHTYDSLLDEIDLLADEFEAPTPKPAQTMETTRNTTSFFDRLMRAIAVILIIVGGGLWLLSINPHNIAYGLASVGVLIYFISLR